MKATFEHVEDYPFERQYLCLIKEKYFMCTCINMSIKEGSFLNDMISICSTIMLMQLILKQD